jgi:hypothetical protein
MIRRMDAVTSPPRERGPSEDRPAETGRVTAGGTRRLRLPSRPWLQFLAFFAALALVLVLVRGDLLWTSGMQNPDEAELMAEGRSAAGNLFPYSDYTTSTHLFLWPFLLGLLGLVGVPLTLVTAHVIGGLSYVLLGTTGWFLTMRRIGGARAALLVLPTALVLLMGYGPGTSDFLSMTSEALPLVILCVAALVMLGPGHPITSRQLVVGSLVAGLAVWAKPQSGPVAAAFVGACVLMACVENHRDRGAASRTPAVRHLVRSMVLAVVAFIAPTVVLLGVMMLGGTLDDFAREPLAAMWGYAADRDVSQGIVAPPLTGRLAGVTSFATSFPFALAWALGALLSTALLARLESRLLRLLGLAAILLPLAAALVCLLPIYPLFPHYATFLYVGCLLATCVAVRLAVPGPEAPAGGRWVEGTYGAVALLAVGMLMLPAVPGQVKDLAQRAGGAITGDGFAFNNEVPRTATRLGVACPPGSRVLVWGWASEFYLYYDWTPASRYANATWLFNPSDKQAEYASILEGELRQDPPGCIVEALGPPFFAGIDPANTLSTLVPGVSSLLDSCYDASDEQTFDGRPVRLYHRKASCPRG